jgi:hypothetical protein
MLAGITTMSLDADLPIDKRGGRYTSQPAEESQCRGLRRYWSCSKVPPPHAMVSSPLCAPLQHVTVMRLPEDFTMRGSEKQRPRREKRPMVTPDDR